MDDSRNHCVSNNNHHIQSDYIKERKRVHIHHTAGHLHTRIIGHRNCLQAAQMAERADLVQIGDAILGQLQRFERAGQKLVALTQMRNAIALKV